MQPCFCTVQQPAYPRATVYCGQRRTVKVRNISVVFSLHMRSQLLLTFLFVPDFDSDSGCGLHNVALV